MILCLAVVYHVTQMSPEVSLPPSPLRRTIDYYLAAASVLVLIICRHSLRILPEHWSEKVGKRLHSLLRFGENGGVSAKEMMRHLGTRLHVKSIMRILDHEAKTGYVSQGDDVPDIALIRVDDCGSETLPEVRLLDLLRNGRPLVINFGSCTFPPFVAKMDSFVDMAKENQEKADFAVIYTKEMNPADGWCFPNNDYGIRQHRDVSERLMAAAFLRDKLSPYCHLFVDNMKDEATAVFRALPERIVVLKAGSVVHCGRRGPLGYNLEEIRTFLQSFD